MLHYGSVTCSDPHSQSQTEELQLIPHLRRGTNKANKAKQTLLMFRMLPCSSGGSMSCSWQTRGEQCTAAAGLLRGRYKLGVVGLMSCCQSSPGKCCSCHLYRDNVTHTCVLRQGWSRNDDTMHAKNSLRRTLTWNFGAENGSALNSFKTALSYLNEGNNILQDGSVQSQQQGDLFCIHISSGTQVYFSLVHNPEVQSLVLLINCSLPGIPRLFVHRVAIPRRSIVTGKPGYYYDTLTKQLINSSCLYLLHQAIVQ